MKIMKQRKLTDAIAYVTHGREQLGLDELVQIAAIANLRAAPDCEYVLVIAPKDSGERERD